MHWVANQEYPEGAGVVGWSGWCHESLRVIKILQHRGQHTEFRV